MQHSGFALLLVWALRHSKWNQIYDSLLQKVVKIKHTLKDTKTFKTMLTNTSLAVLTKNSFSFAQATK